MPEGIVYYAVPFGLAKYELQFCAWSGQIFSSRLMSALLLLVMLHLTARSGSVLLPAVVH